MSYKAEDIKNGIKAHYINTNKFKTNLIAVFITVPLSKETVTLNSLIPAVLKRGTNKLKTQEAISIELENMYGAAFDCGIEKTGDNQILKFYLETLNDNFLPKKEELLKKTLDLIFDIIFNPLVENNAFKKEYVEAEKENIRKIIEGKIDNKDRYAFNRCVEEMYKNKVYGLYKYGYTEDLNKINEKDLYKYYNRLISTAKIDIFVSGDINSCEVSKILKENAKIQKLNERPDIHIINSEQTEKKEIKKEPTKVEEKMDVTQGKLVMGLDIDYNKENSRYAVALYNIILRRKCNIKTISKCKRKSKFSI